MIDLTTRIADSLDQVAARNLVSRQQLDPIVDVLVNRLRSGLHDSTIAWLLLEQEDGSQASDR